MRKAITVPEIVMWALSVVFLILVFVLPSIPVWLGVVGLVTVGPLFLYNCVNFFK